MKSLPEMLASKDFDDIQFENLVAGQISRTGAAYAAAFCVLFGVGYWITGPRAFVPGNFLTAALMAWVAYRQPVSAQFSILLTVNLALLLLGGQLVLLGGIAYAPAVWLVVPCVAVLLVGQRWIGVYAMAASGVLIFGVLGASKAGWIPARVSLPDNDVVMAISVFGAQVLAVVFGVIILRARDQLLVEVRDRTVALTDALVHAQAARDEAEAARQAALRASEEAEQARLEVLEAVRSKEQFFANLTHEIRTPLAGVLGAATLLERGGPRDDQRDFVAALVGSSRALGEVVEAMLDHAKLSVGHVSADLSAVPLRELLASACDLVAPRAKEKRIGCRLDIAADVPDRVWTDAGWLRRILVNLLANAVKFTEAGGVALRVSVEPSTPRDDGDDTPPTLVLEVSDTGIGIAPDKQDAVFAPFVQADASISRRYGGTGLGLAITRRLVELLGGRLSLVSELGRGSTFTVRLPMTVAPIGAEAVALEPAPGATPLSDEALTVGAQRSVLLVEDNAVNRLLASEMLRLLGCRVTTAEGGRQAIDRAGEARFDVVLMDLQMPDLDGITATRAIRDDERARGRAPVPIIALTGNSASDYGEACTRAGMNGFITKPLGLEGLVHLFHDLDDGVLVAVP